MYKDSVSYGSYPRRILVCFPRDVDELHLRYRTSLWKQLALHRSLSFDCLTDRPLNCFFRHSSLSTNGEVNLEGGEMTANGGDSDKWTKSC
jgi:hypothetical protein